MAAMTIPDTALGERSRYQELDRRDDLGRFRGEFEIPPGVRYLDGNSLGALSRRARDRVRKTVEEEWGRGLIASWSAADWMSCPQRTGEKIARLVGAQPGEVVVADSTSVGLYKLLSVALAIDPRRRVIVTDKANFPTDRYIIDGLAAHLGRGHEVLAVDSTQEAIELALAERASEVAAVMLTHVHYTTSRMYDMGRITAAAHASGAVAIWDLSHSAGVMPVDLGACEADFAVGCGYKHLNGGPGAPAFVYVAHRWQDRVQPVCGWIGDARPFEFRSDYMPAPGISRYLSGSPPVIACAALEAAVEVILEAPMASIRRKSIALGDAFIALVDAYCEGLGLELASPRDGAVRGSHISYRHPASYPVMQALIARGVIGDCRPPDLMRFGFAPLYLRYVDVFDAVMAVADVLGTRAWDRPEFQARKKIT